MENETEMIRQQMFETRTALTEKLETLEEQVADKIKGTTDSVVETVETVKEAVESTAHTVSATVEKTVETVKETFDLSHQVNEHPWLVFGGAVLLGYVAARLAGRLSSENGATNGVAPPSDFRVRMPPPPAEQHHWGGEVLESLRPAAAKLGSLAVGLTTGVLGELVREATPAELHHDMQEVLDEATRALGGKPIHFSRSEEAAIR